LSSRCYGIRLESCVLIALAIAIQEVSIGTLEISIGERLRCKIFEQFQSFSLVYFSQTRLGDLINSLTTEINKLKNSFLPLTISLITDGIKLSIYVVAIWVISWKLSSIAVLLLSLLSVKLSTLTRYVRSVSFDISKANANFTSISIEFLSGIFTIHTLATQEFERKRFYRASSEISRGEINSLLKSQLVDPLGIAIGTTIIILLIILDLVFFNLSVPILLTFIYAFQKVVLILQLMNKKATIIGSFQGSLSNIKELLRTDNKPYFQNGKLLFHDLNQSIQLISVDFSYSKEKPVLHNISLEIKKGQMVAFVGSSGAGKSTLASLLLRLYDPQKGEIRIDGVNIREFEISSLRKKISVVSQDTFIFHASVRENIAYGSENTSETAIHRAAQMANAMEFIKELPEGFETLLGDRGVRLSGGQRQRIVIARAILRNSEILILDEATSALDSVSEQLIQEALERLSVNCTVIAIAHRLSTIAKAEMVVVLEKGKIVEQGSYQELIKLQGTFWHYHQLQYK